MSAESLLAAARSAGLKVTAEGDRLVVRGPREAAPLAELLIARKVEVLAALSGVGHGQGLPARAGVGHSVAGVWRCQVADSLLPSFFNSGCTARSSDSSLVASSATARGTTAAIRRPLLVM